MDQIRSKHLFIFPFSWKYTRRNNDPLFKQHNEIKRKSFTRLGNWQEHLSTIETAQDYNEYIYFYKPIRMALYTFAKKPVIVRNYHYAHLDETATITMQVKQKTYCLKLEKINLKLYKTGIGLLSFSVLNTRYHTKADIAAINSLSCCVYPPMMPIEKAWERGLPCAIKMQLYKGKVITESFNDTIDQESIPISSLIMAVLGPPFTCTFKRNSTEYLLIEPILGYQMFCCCLYVMPKGMLSYIKRFSQQEEMAYQLEGWMQLGYQDRGKNEESQGSLMPTWIKNEDHVYGMNRQMLFGWIEAYPCEKFYDQLVQLVLMQRATLLNLSTELARISTLPKSEISSAIASIYEIYIQFINQLYFKEVTEEAEGSLIYDELSKIFKIEEELEQLNFEVDEVHEYALLVEQSASNVKVQMLTIIGAALVLPSFVTGFFGMNIFQKEAIHWWRHQAVALWLNSYVVFPILVVTLLCVWSKRRTTLSLMSKVILGILLLTSLSFTIKYGCGL